MPQRSFALLFLAITGASAQQTFEVASIKRNASGDNRVFIGRHPGGRFTATGITLKSLIGQAYNVREIINGPGWISTERYDVNAKAEGVPDRIPPEQLRPMLRALLEERFQLKTHTASKEMPVYALVVGKGGPKLTPTTSTNQERMLRIFRGQLNSKKTSMATLAQYLSTELGRTVIDKTGLTAEYDLTLNWTPDPGRSAGGPDAVPAADSFGPTIFTALQEQLGLRLESSKGPGDILVIDSVAKPTEN